jgi:DNA-binding NarL/FixJ family response regulator
VVTTEVRSTLTKREVEVARLAARGRPDREIADELCLSVRTVETYHYRIYAKLAVDGRADRASHPEH